MAEVFQNSARPFKIYMADDTDPTAAKTGLTGIIAKLAKSGLGENTVSVTINERGGGWYEVTPLAAHRDTLGESAWTFTHADAKDCPRLEEVIAIDRQDGVRQGMTSLPNAGADAPGGLPISAAGALDLDTKLGRLKSIDNNVRDLRGDEAYPTEDLAAWPDSQMDRVQDSCFWSTRNPVRMLTTGDVQAAVGDTLTKWVSEDGTVTLDAVGSPVLVQLPGRKYPSIRFDGSSGFIKVYAGDNPLDADIQSGSFVAGYRFTGTPSSLQMVLAGCSPANSTAERKAWMTRCLDTSRSSGIAGMWTYSASADNYTENSAIGRPYAFSRFIQTSNGLTYTMRTQGGEVNVVGTNDGNWLGDYVFPTFDRNHLTVAFTRDSAGDAYFFTGEIDFVGWFDSTTDVAKLEAELENAYPTRSVLCLGDSRFNDDAMMKSLDDEQAGHNYTELATGANTIVQGQTEWTTHLGSLDRQYSDIVVLLGVNDTLNNTNAKDALDDMRTLLDTLRTDQPNARILLCNEFPCIDNAGFTLDEQKAHVAYATALTYEAHRREGVYLVDTYTLLEDPANADQMNPAYSSDALHLDPAGDAVFAELLARRVTEVSSGNVSVRETNDNVLAIETGTATIDQQDVRDAMKLAPSAGAADAGSVDAQLASLPADMWVNGTRTLTAFGFPVTISGTKSTLDDLNDIPAGTAMSLTGAERTALAAALEAAIINELDGTAVMQAIADLIADDMTTGDLSVQAIASAVRDAILNRLLAGNHDIAGTPGKLWQDAATAAGVLASQTVITGYVDTRVTSAEGTINGNTNSGLSTLDSKIMVIDGLIDLMKPVTDKLDDTLEDDAGTYRFTTNALEQAPSGGGGGGQVTGFDLAALQQLFTVNANETPVTGSVVKASQGAAGGDVSVDSFTANALQQLSAIKIALISPYDGKSKTLRLVQNVDYKTGTPIGQLRFNLSAWSGISQGDVIRFGATLSNGEVFKAAGTAEDESGTLYAHIELSKESHTNVSISEDDLDARFELQHVNGSGDVSSLLPGQKLIMLTNDAGA